MFRIIAAVLVLLVSSGFISASDYVWPTVSEYEWPKLSITPSPPHDENNKWATELPVMWVYSASFSCPPCVKFDADVAAGKFQEFRVIHGKPPKDIPIDGYPTFHWNGVDGKGNRLTGYTDAKTLIEAWKSTRIKSKVFYLISPLGGDQSDKLLDDIAKYGDGPIEWVSAIALVDGKPNPEAQQFYPLSAPGPHPLLLWKVGRTVYQYYGWRGVNEFLKDWKPSISKPVNGSPVPTKLAPINSWPAFSGYVPRWTWPGDLRTHLRNVHGLRENITQDQAERLHDFLHESGYSMDQVRNYLNRHGILP